MTRFLEGFPSDTPRIVLNPQKLGYGGSLKIAFRHALEKKFDAVCTVIAENSPTAEALAILKDALEKNPATAGFYLGTSPWCATVRGYRTAFLSKVLFELNASDYHFDTELYLQLMDVGTPMQPLRYSDSPYHGLFWSLFSGFLKNMVKARLRYRLQRYNLFYDVRFHPEYFHVKPEQSRHQMLYDSKVDDHSPHALVRDNPNLVPVGSRVLDIGCSSGYVCQYLARSKNCRVTGIDMLDPSRVKADGFDYRQMNLETAEARETLGQMIDKENFDRILMLDVVEHLSDPEMFLLNLYRRDHKGKPKFLFSTGNVAFIGVRLMLLAGFFNYGKQGILDITHKRLFTHRNFRSLLEQTGFVVTGKHFFPIPFRKLGLSNGVASLFEKVQMALIALWPTLFSYQMMFEAVPGWAPDIEA